MCGTLPLPIVVEPTSSSGGSPVSPSVSPESGRGERMTDGSGQSLPDSFARYDPDTSCWKTSQDSYLVDSSGMSSVTFPRAGMMRNGHLYRQRRWVRRTSAKGSLLWPTPTAFDAVQYFGERKESNQENRHAMSLRHAVVRWPTPTARDGRTLKGAQDRPNRTGGPSLAQTMVDLGYQAGALNVEFVEWLMGFPRGWTDLTTGQAESGQEFPA